MQKKLDAFARLLGIMDDLRAKCPWDKKQTTESLKRYLVEEFGEIIEAIDNNDPRNLCEELGDFLYLIIMVSEINHQNGTFSLDDVVRSIDH